MGVPSPGFQLGAGRGGGGQEGLGHRGWRGGERAFQNGTAGRQEGCDWELARGLYRNYPTINMCAAIPAFWSINKEKRTILGAAIPFFWWNRRSWAVSCGHFLMARSQDEGGRTLPGAPAAPGAAVCELPGAGLMTIFTPPICSSCSRWIPRHLARPSRVSSGSAPWGRKGGDRGMAQCADGG